MPKKDYILIADVLANRFNKLDNRKNVIQETQELITITEDLVHALSNDNDAFDRIKFIKYVNTKRVGGGKLLL